MTRSDTRPAGATDLRRSAEEIIARETPEGAKGNLEASPEEMRHALHELKVHQIELEIQNEELRRARAALEVARDRYFDLYDLAPAGYCTLSDKNLVVEANLAAASLLGVSRGSLVTRPLTRFILKSDHDVYHLLRQQVAEIGEPRSCELRMVRSDGAQFWAHLEMAVAQDENGAPILRLVLNDVPERRKQEEALRESEARYRSILDSSPDAVLVTDADRRVVMCSRSAAAMYGFAPGVDLSGKLIAEFFVPEDRARVRADIDASLQDPQRSGRTPDAYRALRADGSSFSVELMSAIIPDSAGELSGMVFDLRDITERKRLEAELRQSQKLEAVGQLAAGIAHDLNTKLSVILGYADLMQDSLRAGKPDLADIREIRTAARNAGELTRRLLGFARKQPIFPRSINLNDTVLAMLGMLGRLAGEAIVLDWNPDPQPCATRMDPGQIDEMLVNLVSNARDAIDGNGTITIRTGHVDLDEHDCATRADAVPGPYAVLAVSDNGSGMTPATQAQIFDPFFTTKPVGEGTGLGLSMVYGIARQNGGFVEVQSQPGEGTTITIYLPRVPREVTAVELEKPAMLAMAPAAAAATVLVVEDDPALLKLTTRLIEKRGFTVIPSGHPVDALSLAAEHAGAIDLLVTDVIMPEMNGAELYRRIQATRPGLRCIFVSGYPADVLAGAGVEIEQVDLLLKPYPPDALAAKLKEVLARG